MDRRETRQREAILNILRSTGSHPTADWIYDEVRKVIPNISKGTVYRNLNLLRDRGAVMELGLSGTGSRTASRYDGTPETHYHFRCNECGRVFDLDEPVDPELDDKIARKTGFKVTHHRTEFHGLCRECQPK